MLSQTKPRTKIFHGAVINPQTLSSYQALPKCLICVAPSGDIAWVVDNVPDSMVQEVMAQKGCLDEDVDFVTLRRGEFLVPGFVDTHTVCTALLQFMDMLLSRLSGSRGYGDAS